MEMYHNTSKSEGKRADNLSDSASAFSVNTPEISAAVWIYQFISNLIIWR